MNLQDYADHLELLGVQALNKRNTTVSFKQCAEYLERVIILKGCLKSFPSS